MKKFNLFLGGLMAIAFTACTNEELLQEGNSNAPSAEQVTITAYTPGDDSVSSRIAQSDVVVGDKTNKKLTWEANTDRISVLYNNQSKVYKSKGNNLFEGDSFGGEVNPVGDYYAAYPYDLSFTKDHTVYPFDLSNQTGADAYLMYATSPNSTGTEYQFRHAAAYLKVRFPESLKGKENVTITLTLPHGVYSKGTINLEDGTLSGTQENTITKVVTFGQETPVVWFAIPPMATRKTLNFVIKTSDNNYIATLASSSGDAIVAGKYYSATINSLLSACFLPSGYDFYCSVKKIGSQINSIEFCPNDNKTTSRELKVEGTFNPSYLDYDSNNRILRIRTKADVFVFDKYSNDMFNGYLTTLYNNLTAINFNNCINTSFVTSMKSMFYACYKLSNLNLSSFDTSNVTNMYSMFSCCTAITTLDLSSFNTANVENMSYMFNMDGYYAPTTNALSTIIFGDNFHTSNVTDMTNMFYKCIALSSLDLCGFTFKSGVNLNNMLTNCTKLANVYVQEDFVQLVSGSSGRPSGTTVSSDCDTHQ